MLSTVYHTKRQNETAWGLFPARRHGIMGRGDVTSMVWWGIAALAAYFVKGLCGFANTLVFTTMLSFGQESAAISPVELLLGYPGNLLLAWRERRAIRDAGVWVVHCADSNQNILSGVAPIRVMLNEGVRVTLGSDIAGGDHLSMFDVAAASIRASKARSILDNWQTDFLTVAEGWYLATSAGAEFFGEKPGFAPGNPLHAIVLRDDALPAVRKLTARERFERCVYRRQEGALRAVWSAGRKIYAAE